MLSYRCMLRPTYLNVDFSSSAEVKIKVKIQFQTFLKKKMGFHVEVASDENLSIDV